MEMKRLCTFQTEKNMDSLKTNRAEEGKGTNTAR